MTRARAILNLILKIAQCPLQLVNTLHSVPARQGPDHLAVLFLTSMYGTGFLKQHGAFTKPKEATAAQCQKNTAQRHFQVAWHHR